MPSATVRRAMTAGALTAAFALSLSVAASATATAQDEDIVRMQFTGYTTNDTAPRFISAGKSWTTYLDLYTHPKKKFAGDASSRCTAIEAENSLWAAIGGDSFRLTTQCSRVLRLKDGTISLHDTITREGKKAITAKTAIVGGTGLYNDAEGEGYITLKGDEVHFDLHVDD
ncbi:hypothetical protein ACQEVY_16135 [Streptomyces sp. CA-288835]|uniref:hypothetical protein n=1 Tax=Streptomyces sp. CA-288835 TaxID=3240069 RepID=UPI003D918FFF